MNILKFTLLSLVILTCSIEYSLADGNKLLRSVKSGYIVTKYQYNSDSTLHSIRKEWNGELRSESKLIYKDGKVSEIIWKSPSEKSKIRRVYEYKGNLLIKATAYRKKEVLTMVEYFYNENNQLIKQIQKLEWNDEANKQTRIIDIHKVAGKNEIQLKYNGRLSYIITYDDKANPYFYIKGYSEIYASQFHGITNNILMFKRIDRNGNETYQKSDLTFDSSGRYIIKIIKKDHNKRLICEEIYTY